MKASKSKSMGTSQSPVFPKAPDRVRPKPNSAASTAKSKKRTASFSKSRKVPGRGTRQMKTRLNSQMLFRECGNSTP